MQNIQLIVVFITIENHQLLGNIEVDRRNKTIEISGKEVRLHDGLNWLRNKCASIPNGSISFGHEREKEVPEWGLFAQPLFEKGRFFGADNHFVSLKWWIQVELHTRFRHHVHMSDGFDIDNKLAIDSEKLGRVKFFF